MFAKERILFNEWTKATKKHCFGCRIAQSAFSTRLTIANPRILDSSSWAQQTLLWKGVNMQRKSRQISTHFAIRVGWRFHDWKCACGFETRITSSARDASEDLPEEPRPNPNPNPNRVALRFHMHCAITALPFCIATLVAAAAARSPVTQPACATWHLFRSREAEA